MKCILTFGEIEDVKTEFGRLGISPICQYYGLWFYDMVGCWAMKDEDYAAMDADIKSGEADKNWQKCGWRYAEGSNLGAVHKRFNVNHHYLKGWDNNRARDGIFISTYSNLHDYICEHLGASTERNVTAVLVDLAAQNHMPLHELLDKFQGGNTLRL